MNTKLPLCEVCNKDTGTETIAQIANVRLVTAYYCSSECAIFGEFCNRVSVALQCFNENPGKHATGECGCR